MPAGPSVRVGPGAHGVHAYALRTEFCCPRLREEIQGGFARAVHRHPSDAEIADHTAHVDDRAFAAIGHFWRHLSNENERRLRVGCIDVVKRVEAGLRRRSKREYAGIIDEDPDAS